MQLVCVEVFWSYLFFFMDSAFVTYLSHALVCVEVTLLLAVAPALEGVHHHEGHLLQGTEVLLDESTKYAPQPQKVFHQDPHLREILTLM